MNRKNTKVAKTLIWTKQKKKLSYMTMKMIESQVRQRFKKVENSLTATIIQKKSSRLLKPKAPTTRIMTHNSPVALPSKRKR